MARTIGIDTGGTFTDLVQVEDGEVRIAKVPSTPKNPGDAIANGLEELRANGGAALDSDHIVHGTTVALNALLTGRVAKVGLVTGSGFADLIEIGRQARPDIYALEPEKTEPLVPQELRFEVESRVWPRVDGSALAGKHGRELEVVARPSADELARLARRIERSQAESLAVCLLHSWADPRAEQEIGRALGKLGLPLTLSGEVLPEHREFERFSTAVVNAALVPLMEDYLGRLGERLAPARLSLLQSTGGTLAAGDAAREPVRVLLSGPAGGVVGAARAAAEVGFDRFATFDMGGTSTDVAFHHAGGSGGEREARRSSEPVLVAGHPIGVPTLDIHTIGCGGGSIVQVDAGGVLHVGPESAGASPGPVCYGQSDRPTVTDAHVLLGHVAEGPFLAGELELDHRAVRRAFEKLGGALGVDAIEAAHGVLDVARAAMRRAIGVMTMQRGADPERLPLIAFGGAGGLQGAALAKLLRMPATLIPRFPGALSAGGMTAAAPLRDHVRTVLTPLAPWGRRDLARIWKELGAQGRAELIANGHARGEIRFEYSLDLRYAGQSFEIQVPQSIGGRGAPDPVEAFHAAHARLYGYRLDERPIELVRLHTRAFVPEPARHAVRVRARAAPDSVVHDQRPVHFEPGKRPVRTPVIERSRLRPGHWIAGPALVEEYSGTTLVPPGQRLSITAGEHLLID